MNSSNLLQPIQLKLLGGFMLSGTEEIGLPISVQRLVAMLALRERPLSRAYLADALWPDCSPERSLADLRTTLWRANRCGTRIIVTAGMRLCLHSQVWVDVRVLRDFGSETNHATRNLLTQLAGISWLDLSLDLLPDWYDEWLVDDRESVRQLRLHTLERLTDELSLRGRHEEAIQAALAAVHLEPLRETAHAALIRAHLAEGNRSEALRQFYRCRDVLVAELAVEPSESMRKLIYSSVVLSTAESAS